jgi:hypothetical protein
MTGRPTQVLKVVIPGGSGQVGTVLARALHDDRPGTSPGARVRVQLSDVAGGGAGPVPAMAAVS